MPSRDRKSGGWLALGSVLLLVLVAGAWVVARAPLETGDAYPPYSSLRTDPLGAKALYESLQALPEVSVSRRFRDGGDLDAKSALVLLGVNAEDWPGRAGRSLAEYEKLVAKGGRLVLGFLPANPRRDRNIETSARDRIADDEETDGAKTNPPKTNNGDNDLNQRWHVRMIYRTRGASERVARGQLPRHTALSFTLGPEWKILAQLHGLPVVAERMLGPGSVVLIAESYPLSNEGLRDARDAKLLVDVVGPARRMVFDENHLGVSDSGSVAGLMRKYHLEGAVGMLLLAALLFVWRSSSSFLPPTPPLAMNGISGGRDTQAAMAALLRRSATEKQLIQTCYTEWSKFSSNAPGSKAAGEMVSALIEQFAGSGPVETYQAVSQALSAKRKSK